MLKEVTDVKCQRHIWLNPSDYSIPSNLLAFISTIPFSKAVSKALVSICAELKHQVCQTVVDVEARNADYII